MCAVCGRSSVSVSDHVSHTDCRPGSATTLDGVGIDGIDEVVPESVDPVAPDDPVDPEGEVVVGLDVLGAVGTVVRADSAYAKRFGDCVPAFVTTAEVAALVTAFIT